MIITKDEIIFDNEEQKKEVEETSKYYNSLSKEQLEHLERVEKEKELEKHLERISAD
jgi:hypothetical protein